MVRITPIQSQVEQERDTQAKLIKEIKDSQLWVDMKTNYLETVHPEPVFNLRKLQKIPRDKRGRKSFNPSPVMFWAEFWSVLSSDEHFRK